MEIPGKSSSEDEPQGATFSGGDTLMGTTSDCVLPSSCVCVCVCIVILSLSKLIFVFLLSVMSSHHRGEFTVGFGQCGWTGS